MANTITTRIALKNDTSINWESSTLVLLKGEIAIATDLNKFKIGDGEHTWKDLEYVGASIEEIISAVDGAYKDADGKIKEELIDRNSVWTRDMGMSKAEYEKTNSITLDDQWFMDEATSDHLFNPEVKKGDIYIYYFPIKDKNDEIIAKSSVALICTEVSEWGEELSAWGTISWKRLNDAEEAENVYFNSDLTITANVGVQTVGASGSTTLETKGKTVKQVMDMIFAKELFPSVDAKAPVTKPSVSAVTIKQNGTTLTKNTTYEVGTVITPSYEISYNSGSYPYTPTATGCTVKTYHVNDSIADTVEGHSEVNTQTGSFSAFDLADGQTYKISATIEYNAGNAPLTNLGNAYEAGKITAGTTASKDSYTISGYRKMFWGGLVSPSTGEGAVALDSDVIRGLTKSQAAGSATLTVKASDFANAKRIIVAIPTSSNKSITEVLLASLANTPITGQFKLQDNTVDVEGANDYEAKPYKIYIYEPAAIDAGEIYTIKIG